jgi:hypothetical protein
MKSLLSRLFAPKKPATRRPAAPCRPTVEALEDRQLLSWGSLPPPVVNLHSANDYHYNIGFGTAGGYSQTNAIVNQVEVDYRTFTAQRSGLYTFDAQATPGSGIDTVAALYDTGGNRLASNDDYGGSLNSHFTRSLTAGQTYVFGITNYNGSPIGAYRATIAPPSLSANSAKGGNGWFASGDATLTRSNLHLDLSATDSSLFSPHTDRVYVQILGLNGQPLFQNVWSHSVSTVGTLVPGASSASGSWNIDLSAFDLSQASSLRVWVD